MTEAEAPRSRKPVLVGCLTIAALVIGIPAACTAVLSLNDPRDTHDISARVAEQVGFEWPLTVEAGLVWCVGAGRLVFEADGTQYALNGLAKGAGEYDDIEPIWLDDPEVDGLKVGIDGLIDWGNTVCGY